MTAEFTNIMPWIWLGVFVILVIIEAATQGLTTVWGAISALIMVPLSVITGFGVGWQILLFLIMTFGFLFSSRPFFLKKFKMGKYATNVDMLKGQDVVVTKAITRFEKGEARAKNGVIWSATSESGADIAVGSVCRITGVEGNTLILQVVND